MVGRTAAVVARGTTRFGRLGAPRLGGPRTTRPPMGGQQLATLMRAGVGRAADGLSTAGRSTADWATSASTGALDRLQAASNRAVAVPELPVVVEGSRTLTVPLRVMLVADVSGSTSTSDPDRASYKAVRAAVEWMAANSGDERDRVGLVRFAVNADSLAPVRVGQAAAAIDAALAASTDRLGGGTTLMPAVDELCSHLARRQGRTVVVLITDGQVSEPDVELRALVGRVRSNADAVYLLALDHDHQWGRLTHRRYDALGLDAIYAIGTLGAAHIASTITRVLVHEAGLLTASGGGA